METLAKKFEEELKLKMLRAKKECKYNPTRFNQMLATYGGVETAKRLISNAQKRVIHQRDSPRSFYAGD